MKWKVFLKRSKLSVLEAEVVNGVERVGYRACATRRRGPAARTYLDRSLAAAAFGRLAGTQLWRALEARCQLRVPPATSDARGKDKRFVLFLNGRIFVKKVAGLW